MKKMERTGRGRSTAHKGEGESSTTHKGEGESGTTQKEEGEPPLYFQLPYF